MIDLSPGQPAYVVRIALSPPRAALVDQIWGDVLAGTASALADGVTLDGTMVAFAALGRARSGDVALFLFFVEQDASALSAQQRTLISRAMARCGGVVHAELSETPAECAPVAMHVDGNCLRIALPSPDGTAVRHRLGIVRRQWALVADEVPIGGLALNETTLDLPIAVVGPAPDTTSADVGDDEEDDEVSSGGGGPATLTVPATGKTVLVLLDLRGAQEQWGPLAWTVIEDRIARILLATMTGGSQMIVRSVLDSERMQLSLSFQYTDLGADFVLTLFDVFGDFDATPICVGAIDVEAGVPGMFAAIQGRPFVLVQSKPRTPTIRQLDIKGKTARWVSFELRDAGSVPFSLRRVRRSRTGAITLDVERTVPFRVARLVEVAG